MRKFMSRIFRPAPTECEPFILDFAGEVLARLLRVMATLGDNGGTELFRNISHLAQALKCTDLIHCFWFHVLDSDEVKSSGPSFFLKLFPPKIFQYHTLTKTSKRRDILVGAALNLVIVTPSDVSSLDVEFLSESPSSRFAHFLTKYTILVHLIPFLDMAGMTRLTRMHAKRAGVIYGVDVSDDIPKNTMSAFTRTFHKTADPNLVYVRGCGDGIRRLKLEYCQHMLTGHFRYITSLQICNLLRHSRTVYLPSLKHLRVEFAKYFKDEKYQQIAVSHLPSSTFYLEYDAVRVPIIIFSYLHRLRNRLHIDRGTSEFSFVNRNWSARTPYDDDRRRSLSSKVSTQEPFKTYLSDVTSGYRRSYITGVPDVFLWRADWTYTEKLVWKRLSPRQPGGPVQEGADWLPPNPLEACRLATLLIVGVLASEFPLPQFTVENLEEVGLLALSHSNDVWDLSRLFSDEGPISIRELTIARLRDTENSGAHPSMDDDQLRLSQLSVESLWVLNYNPKFVLPSEICPQQRHPFDNLITLAVDVSCIPVDHNTLTVALELPSCRFPALRELNLVGSPSAVASALVIATVLISLSPSCTKLSMAYTLMPKRLIVNGQDLERSPNGNVVSYKDNFFSFWEFSDVDQSFTQLPSRAWDFESIPSVLRHETGDERWW